MDYSLGHVLADVIMCYFEELWLEIVELSSNLLRTEDISMIYNFFAQQNM